ncbi:Unknown protein sequence [Pseudomonas syringae pv. coryli]|uniref:Uncharacterized protein n=1 Tax=Pseudomonas syringae pv. coryli TaxID=317659 RepID=A0A0P9QPT9_9PSED|nr:Unknown protein sequence [Pseudomonas syringae pv. coryli]
MNIVADRRSTSIAASVDKCVQQATAEHLHSKRDPAAPVNSIASAFLHQCHKPTQYMAYRQQLKTNSL